MRVIRRVIYTLIAIYFYNGTQILEAQTSNFPKQIMIIRHAEKSLNAYNEIPFLTNGLTLKGIQRAAALAPYFMGTPQLTKFGPPVAVYATHPTLNYEALRPLETAMPTAEALKLDVNQKYTISQEEALIKEILETPTYQGKNVLICWEHHHIPQLLQALNVSPHPKPWPDNVFDWVYVIQLDHHGKVSSFKIIPQQLMYGDAEKISA